MRGCVRGLAVLLVALALIAPTRLPADPLQVGSDVSGAPFEYFQGSSKVPLGFDIDLLHAMIAKMGNQADVVNHQFDDLLAAVRRGKFNFAISAISDTSTREKQVDFLDYFVAGGGIMVNAGNPYRIFGIDALCGYSVTVESGTSYLADLEKESKTCVAVGLHAINILTFSTDDSAFAAFIAGKAPAYVADYPVSVYRARFANDGKTLEVVGRQFDVVPYGIAFSKQNAALMKSMQQALLAVVADGTYDKLLRKWGLQEGGLRFAPINAGILYEK
jgi:polar amino acid transport system substrate-binding protein